MTRSLLAGILLFAAAVVPAAATNVNPYYVNNELSGDFPQAFTSLGGPASSPGVAFIGNAASGGFAGYYVVAPGSTTAVALPAGNVKPTGGALGGLTGGAVAGIVVARTVDSTPNGPHTGVFAFPMNGSAPTQLSNTNFSDPSYAPATSPGGTAIAFKDLGADGSSSAIYAQPATGGIRITVSGANYSRMGRPAVNDALDVAFVAQLNGESESKVYVKTMGRPDLVAVPLRTTDELAGDQVSIVTNGDHLDVSFLTKKKGTTTVSMSHSDVYIPQGLASVASPVLTGTDAEPLGDLFSASPAGYLTKKGYDAWKAISVEGTSNLISADPVRLLGIGDVVGSSTVTDIAMSQSSLLDNGDALLYLTLANGDHGFYLVSVPEPATTMLLAAPALLMRRRRA